jgi:hypothetical protein
MWPPRILGGHTSFSLFLRSSTQLAYPGKNRHIASHHGITSQKAMLRLSGAGPSLTKDALSALEIGARAASLF